MTTSINSISIAVSDPSLQFFHDRKESLFNRTMNEFESVYPAWTQEYDSLLEFEIKVRGRGGDFQHIKVRPPGKGELEIEREGYLKQYWSFKRTCDKIAYFSSNTFRVITFLTPEVRSFTEEQRLLQEQPDLYEQIKKCDEAYKKYVSDLTGLFDKTNLLREKMLNFISSQLGWSLQRFCQIVDNDGNPISPLLRFVDRVTSPIIPKPQNLLSMSEPNDKLSTENS